MKLFTKDQVVPVKNSSHERIRDDHPWFEDFYFSSKRFENFMLSSIVNKIDNEYKE